GPPCKPAVGGNSTILTSVGANSGAGGEVRSSSNPNTVSSAAHSRIALGIIQPSRAHGCSIATAAIVFALVTPLSPILPFHRDHEMLHAGAPCLQHSLDYNSFRRGAIRIDHYALIGAAQHWLQRERHRGQRHRRLVDIN